jgi:DNA-binding PadR family transcriptional regulator
LLKIQKPCEKAMLTELLILFVLLNQECTIYKIRKSINKYFSLFHSTSMGSIHPALKKFHAQNYVSVKKSMSKGGQRSSVYSVTDEGRKYFETLMLEDLPENPAAAAQFAKIKMFLLSTLEKPVRKSAIANLKDYYRDRLLDFENFREDYKSVENLSMGYIKHCIDSISEEINWLNFQELN